MSVDFERAALGGGAYSEGRDRKLGRIRRLLLCASAGSFRGCCGGPWVRTAKRSRWWTVGCYRDEGGPTRLCMEAQKGRRGLTCEERITKVSYKAGNEGHTRRCKLPRCLPSNPCNNTLRESGQDPRPFVVGRSRGLVSSPSANARGGTVDGVGGMNERRREG